MFFLLSAISFQRVNGRKEGVGSLRRNGIRRQGVFFGVHFYILRVLCVIECNRWATSPEGLETLRTAGQETRRYIIRWAARVAG